MRLCVGALLTIFLATAASVAPAKGPIGSPPALSAPCREAMEGDWKKAVAAYGAKKWQDTISLAAATATACAADAGVQPLTATLSADAMLRAGQPAAALAMLRSSEPPRGTSLWATGRLIQLAALVETNDRAGFAIERDKLLAANAAGMLAGDYWESVEQFDTPLARVTAYRRRDGGKGLQDNLFIASPKEFAMPISYEVNEGGVGFMITKSKDELGDLNACYMHATLTPVKSTANGRYAALKARAVELFSNPQNFEPPPSDTPGAAGFCPGWVFIFPALAPSDP